MLPPVSAVLSADASYHIITSRSEPVATTPAQAAIAQPLTDATNLSASTNVRAVSGELQLSRHVGVLAETLGRLVNVARMDGEAADTYVARLVTTIQSMPADQRAILEKAIDSLLKGMTLSILIDALKNSAGPQAARVAAMFELVRSSGAGKEQKIFASPYLQDVHSQGSRTAPPRINHTTPQTPAGLSRPVDTLPAMTVGAESPPTSTKPTVANLLERGDATSRPIAGSSTTNLSEALPSSVKVASARQDMQSPNVQLPSLTASMSDSGKNSPVIAARHDQVQMKLNQPSALSGAMPQPASIASQQSEIGQQTDVLRPVGNLPQFTVSALGPLNASHFAGTKAKDMEALLLAAFLGKLPVRIADTAPQMLPAALPEQAKANAKPSASSTAQSKTEAGAQDNLATNRSDAMIAQRAAVAAELKVAFPDQPTLQAAVAALITKEGIPLPFVQYPSAKDEPESDAPPRGRWPSSEGEAGEEETGQGHHEDGSDQEERHAANDESVDHSLSEGGNDESDAESYYLRMSNFS